jgi:transcriptional regulator with XRE-family HTH domain
MLEEPERIRKKFRTRQTRTQMRLSELRRAQHLSQAAIAERLELQQGDISKLERRTDMYLHTLRSYVEASGGTLRLVVEFPDETEIELDLIGNIDERTKPSTLKKQSA